MNTRLRLVLLALVAVALAAAPAWRAWQEQSSDPDEELARLVPGHRPLLGRTSLAAAYAPFDPAAPKVGAAEREGIYARLLAAKVAGVSGARRALASFYAARGEPGDAERALADGIDPVDRGVVLLALDRADEALEEFAKALDARPADPAALFDRALALEALLLPGQAAIAWDAFLAAEPRGGWSDEGRRRLGALRAPAEAARLSLEQRKREAVERLYEPRPARPEELREVADELVAAGDRLLHRELDFLAGLDEAGWRRRAEEARRFAGLRADVLAGMDRTEPLAAIARSTDPLLAVKALHFGAYGAIFRDDLREGERWLHALGERCRALGCVEELALATSDLGTLRQRRGDYVAAAAAYDAARAALPELFETRLAEVDAKRASVELRSEAPERAIRLLNGAIRTERRWSGRNLGDTLSHLGMAEHELGRTAAALASWAEAAAVCREKGYAGCELDAIRMQAKTSADRGRRAEGIALLAELIGRLRATNLHGHLALVLDDLATLQAREGALGDGRRNADEALALARDGGSTAVLAGTLATRARVARFEEDRPSALRWLREAVALDEGRAVDAPGPMAILGVRASTASDRLLLALVQGETGDAAGAFASFAGGAPTGLGDDECRVGMGHVEDRLLVVSAAPSGFAFRAHELPAERLEATLQSREAVAELAALALEPGVCSAGTRRLSVLEVPGSLPVSLAGAIRDRRPELLVAVTGRPDARWPGPLRPTSALVIHDPALRAHGMPSLPGAEREAELVRNAVEETVDLRGEQASPDEVTGRASAADLLHFAVHGIARRGAGAASYLLLAGEPGRLQVADILELDLRARRPLVVLSACRTAGVSRELEHDGAGLPWAFLQAGATAVLANEGDLDDGLAVEFTRAFYRELGAGTPVAEAAARAGATTARPTGASGNSKYLLYF